MDRLGKIKDHVTIGWLQNVLESFEMSLPYEVGPLFDRLQKRRQQVTGHSTK